jgi:hypothetical protein
MSRVGSIPIPINPRELMRLLPFPSSCLLEMLGPQVPASTTARDNPSIAKARIRARSKDSLTWPDCRFPMADQGTVSADGRGARSFLVGFVGPYQPWQALPSGQVQTITVNVTLGGDVPQDIVMQDSAVQKPDWCGPTTMVSPAPLPAAGDWAAWLDPCGGLDYFWFSGQANRTLSV